MNVPLEHTLEVLIACDMYCETNAREYIESFILKNLAEVDAGNHDNLIFPNFSSNSVCKVSNSKFEKCVE